MYCSQKDWTHTSHVYEKKKETKLGGRQEEENESDPSSEWMAQKNISR